MPCQEGEIDSLPRLGDDPIINADLRSCLLEDIQYDRYAATSCIHCCTENRIKNFCELYPGAHISMAGENLKFNFCKSQYSGYKHHALVTSVEPINNGFSAVMTMIHFIWTPFAKSIKIRETKEIRHLYNDDIILIKYRSVTNTRNEIIQRARSLLQNSEERKYSVLEFNCEHLIRWCVNGTSQCLQVDNIFKTVTNWGLEVGGAVGKIVRFIGKVRDINIIREFTNAAGLSLEELIHSGGSKKFDYASKALLGVIAAFYLIICIYRTYKIYKKYQNKEICGSCRYRQCAEIWLQFTAYLITNVGGYFVFLLAPNHLLAAFAFAGSLILSLTTMYYLPKAWNMFKGPFRGENTKVSDLKDIQEGDVVTFHYCELAHDGIVSSIKIDKNSEGRKGKLTIIHYTWPSIFSRRTIKEETVGFDLNKDKLWINHFNGYKIYSPDEVIRRARMRLNERKFAIFSNRSPHFCFWAKVQNFEKEKEDQSFSELVYDRTYDEKNDRLLPHTFIDHRMGKLHSSHLLGKREVRSREEIQLGDLVEFNYGLNPCHTAVCTGIVEHEEDKPVVTLTLVHCGKSYTVVEEDIDFDLRRESLRIHDQHPVHRFPRDSVVDRAKAKIGETHSIFSWSSHLTSEIVHKHSDTVITSMNDVVPGDAVVYSYWGLLHEGVVVKKSDKKLKIVHYGTQNWNLFASREIIQEWQIIEFDGMSKIYKKGFDGYLLYPNEIAIERAMSRVGEKRFSALHNRSFEFVHWSKVVQKPTVFSFRLQRILVIPHVGKPTEDENFQEDWVKTWKDLEIGSILHLREKYGILVRANEEENTIHIVQRKQKSIGLMNSEHKLRIDLKESKEIIYIYRCDPSKAALSTDIVSTCRSYKGHKTEWDFCRHCVLRDSLDETVPRLKSQKMEDCCELTFVRPYDEHSDRKLSKYFDKDKVNRTEMHTHVNSPNDVESGDAVIYSYWGFWHHGLVVDKRGNELRIVHYGTHGWNLIANREIIAEWETINSEGNTTIFKNGFNGHLLYPNEIAVQRALSRVGERRFNTYKNKSNHFVHWCKVVQRPTIYRLRGEDILFKAPQSEGYFHGVFSTDWIKTWEELLLGSTISLRGYHGILEYAAREDSVICILYRVGKIPETKKRKFEINLEKSKEVINIHSVDPTLRRLSSEIISTARTYTGSKTGWEFLKHCTLSEIE